jgi:hypothetical protein
MKKVVFLFLMAGTISCSSIKVVSDYDREADFTKYKTYSMGENNLTEAIGQLNSDRVMKALIAELEKKGFTKSDSPDMIVDVFVKTQKKVQATAYNTGGYGYGRYGYGGGFSTTHVNYDEYTDGTMFINFIDKATEKIVWQGTGSKTLDENAGASKRESAITYSIGQIMTQYPPSKK